MHAYHCLHYAHTHTHTHTHMHAQASVVVWRRFGSRGDIEVSGVASMLNGSQQLLPQGEREAALEGIDFPFSPVSTSIPDGETVGILEVPLYDNAAMEPLKAFRFSLSAVQRIPSESGDGHVMMVM